MKILPTHSTLLQHINHYWVVQDATNWFMDQQYLYAFPGITPEIIIVLEGQLTYRYLGQRMSTCQSTLFGFLHGDIHLDFSELRRFVVVVFQAHALASIIPFLRLSAKDLIRYPIQPLVEMFPDFNNAFLQQLRNSTQQELIASLNDWLLTHCQPSRSSFITDLTNEMPPNFELTTLRNHTNYSASTLERYFKQETGLRPKQYQRLHRFRGIIEHFYATQNADWGQYVDKFGFFDQSHFIKEIRAFTGFTPSRLLKTPGLLPLRPK